MRIRSYPNYVDVIHIRHKYENYCRILPLRGRIREDLGRESSYACDFVNLRDNFMKFGESVQKRVERRCQNEFSPGGTLRGDFSTLTDFSQFLRLRGR